MQPYPIPREARISAEMIADGVSSVYGPFSFQIFDAADVVVLLRLATEVHLAPFGAVTVEKTSTDSLATFRVVFDNPPPTGARFVVAGRRIHERSVQVTKGGALSADALELELSKQAATLEELRRDADQAVDGQRAYERALRTSSRDIQPLPDVPLVGKVPFFDEEQRPSLLDVSAIAETLTSGFEDYGDGDADDPDATIEDYGDGP